MKVSDKPSKREHQSTATNNQKLKKGFKRYLVGRKGVDSSLSPGARRTDCASLAHQLHLRLPLFFCWISVQQPNQQGTKAGRALKTEDLQVLLVSHTHTHTRAATLRFITAVRKVSCSFPWQLTFWQHSSCSAVAMELCSAGATGRRRDSCSAQT